MNRRESSSSVSDDRNHFEDSVGRKSSDKSETIEIGAKRESLAGASDEMLKETQQIAQRIEESSLSPKRKEHLMNRLARNLQEAVRVFSFGAALLGVMTSLNYKMTRYFVKKDIDDKGGVVYLHEDERTTHVINMLSGRERLNDEDKREILIDFFVRNLQFLQEKGLYADKNENSFNDLPLGVLKKMTNEIGPVLGYSKEVKMEDVAVVDPSPKHFDREVYEALWKLEQECGNPEIRFRLGRGKKAFGVYDPERSFYNPITNTMYINFGNIGLEDVTAHYIAELSHGKQFNDSPISSTIAGVKDMIGSMKNGILRQGPTESHNGHALRSIEKTYDNLYKTPGSLEYNAHREIEPELRRQFDSLTPKRVAINQEREYRLKKINDETEIKLKELEKEKKELLGKENRNYTGNMLNREITKRTDDEIIEEHQKNRNELYDKYKKKEEEVRKQAELKKQQLERDLEK